MRARVALVQYRVELMEGPRPGDPVSHQMSSMLKADHRAFGAGAVTPVGRPRGVTNRGQLALKPADRVRATADVSGAQIQNRLGDGQCRPRERAGDSIGLQAVRGLEADHRVLGEHAVASVDRTRWESGHDQATLKEPHCLGPLGGGVAAAERQELLGRMSGVVGGAHRARRI
jgi:hypothetical protein